MGTPHTTVAGTQAATAEVPCSELILTGHGRLQILLWACRVSWSTVPTVATCSNLLLSSHNILHSIDLINVYTISNAIARTLNCAVRMQTTYKTGVNSGAMPYNIHLYAFCRALAISIPLTLILTSSIQQNWNWQADRLICYQCLPNHLGSITLKH